MLALTALAGNLYVRQLLLGSTLLRLLYFTALLLLGDVHILGWATCRLVLRLRTSLV